MTLAILFPKNIHRSGNVLIDLAGKTANIFIHFSMVGVKEL
jgi:hypothetical protein